MIRAFIVGAFIIGGSLGLLICRPAQAACSSSNECSSKINGYAVLRNVAVESSKINGYAVLQNIGVESSKINGYAVLASPGLAASKTNGYAVLSAGPNAVTGLMFKGGPGW